MTRNRDPLILVLLALSLSLNVYLYRQRATMPPAFSPLKPGSTVPAIEAKTLDGHPYHLDFKDRPAVLYVFSPRCVWCAKNLQNARALAHNVQPRFRFVAIAIESEDLASYLRGQNLRWEVVHSVSPSVARAFKLGPTPQTIVVAKGGTVLHSWIGAFQEKNAAEIERFAGIRLPGLVDPQTN